jgi:7-keto-8-aminopelargonate synthetase-like enzyme
MDGDLAPLPELVELAEKYGCMVMVDDAHATGVLGKRGSGATEYFSVEDRVPIVMGTLSKAVGSLGGYVAGSRTLIDFLRNRARTYIFDTSLPASSLAASQAAIDIIEFEPERRKYLWYLIERFKSGLKNIGLELLTSHSAVIPVLIVKLSQHLILHVCFVKMGYLHLLFVRLQFHPASAVSAPLSWRHTKRSILS